MMRSFIHLHPLVSTQSAGDTPVYHGDDPVNDMNRLFSIAYSIMAVIDRLVPDWGLVEPADFFFFNVLDSVLLLQWSGLLLVTYMCDPVVFEVAILAFI